MSLLALVLALVLERVLTDLLHLRDARWLDGYFDWAARLFGGWRGRLLGNEVFWRLLPEESLT